MEFVLLGWSDDGPRLRLDHEQFSYAGKFVMSSTGKAVVRENSADGTDSADSDGRDDDTDQYADDVLAAVSFDPDRSDPDRLRCRYVTVREDYRGEGLGPRLLRFVAETAKERGFDRVTIAVNNPYAYEAAYRAGFAFTGKTTGLAELVCEYPAADPDTDRYQAGLDRFRERDLTDAEEEFLATRETPPEIVDSPA